MFGSSDCFKSFIGYCHIDSNNNQRQLVKTLVLDILSIILKYVAQNTLYHIEKGRETFVLNKKFRHQKRERH